MTDTAARTAPKRVVVIGAGAAGTMAAIFAARGGAHTTLLEGTKDGGRKILISGGGRCNVLPLRLDESRFVTDSSPNTLRRIVRSWPLTEQRAFFEHDVGVPLSDEPELLKVFPTSHKARDVRDGLLALARRSGAELRFDTRVTDVRPITHADAEPALPPAAPSRAMSNAMPNAMPNAMSNAMPNAMPNAMSNAMSEGARWLVELAGGERIPADAVILAAGGLSVPNTGSDGTGLTIAERLGHTMHPVYAALTPLLGGEAQFAALAGVSLSVTLTARSETRSASATGGFLFTHRGYSGPAVLNVSHVVVRSRLEGGPPARVTVQWSPLDDAAWEQALRPQGQRTVLAAVRAEVPDRLAHVLLAVAGVDPARSLAELRREERLRLIATLVRGELPWTGDEGYKKAEVTGGGVSLAEVEPRTMESRRHPGLFLCGELLDAFGPIGGYNFLWAWATGRAAGCGAAGARPTR